MRKEEQLQVKIPSFFKCPISLDVMKSPVSLCTGVTYDRSSIQRWLECGNNTCPATMQLLPTTDFVPNHTLHRLIHLWSSAGHSKHSLTPLLHAIRSSSDPLPPLQKLVDFFSDDDDDDSDKISLISSTDCVPTLTSLLKEGARLETLEAAIRVLSLILTVDCIDRSSLVANLDGSAVSSLLRVLHSGTTLDSRIDSARVFNSILSSSDPESKLRIIEKTDLIPELIRLISETDRTAIDAGLSCLISASALKRVRAQIVRSGIVPALTRVLTLPVALVSAVAAEKGLRLMEAAAAVAEGRAEICEEAERCVAAVVGRMMKVGREGTEAAVVVLWRLCHVYRERRAQEAVMGVDGGVTKVLLVLQSDCSPAVRQMCGDLMKIFRVNSKSCLSGYNTKTAHIMPF